MVWNGETPRSEDDFTIPVRLRDDRSYAIRILDRGGELTTSFEVSELPRDQVIYSTLDGNVTVDADVWRDRAKKWCEVLPLTSLTPLAAARILAIAAAVTLAATLAVVWWYRRRAAASARAAQA